ncbi:MAG: hypothetical protein C0501_01395 [Isosphaera sp.]|nr:hypothetical protein [Isosphaera sp.]
MSTDTTPPPTPVLLDLTGLPEGFVRYVQQLVREAREKRAPYPRSPTQADLERWSAEFRAWIASLPVRPTTMDDSRESMYEG